MTNIVSLKLLKTVFNSPHANGLTQGSPAHENGLRFVAEVLRWNQDPDFHVGLIGSLLPETYKGNLLPEVPGMTKDGVRKGYHQIGSNLEGGAEQSLGARANSGMGSQEKQSVVAIEAVESIGVELFKDEHGRAYATSPDHGNGSVAIPIDSSQMQTWVNHSYYKKTGRPLSATASKEAVDTLRAKALFEGEKRKVHIRLGMEQGVYYVDRGTSKGSFIRISNGNWTVEDNAPVIFSRPQGFAELPLPDQDDLFEPEELKALLGLDDKNWVLFCGSLIGAFNPQGPYLILLVQGEHGSGKSYLCALVKKVVDPSSIQRSRLPKNEQDLAIQAQHNHVLAFDNASNISPDMSDFLCIVSTGGSFSTRKLYENDELQVFAFVKPLVINGIGDFAYRPDMLDRSIQLNLPAIQPHGRKTEREMNAAVERLLPGFLGYILDCVAYAQQHLSNVEPPRNMRMADAAQFILAAEPAMGVPQGAILQALEATQKEIMAARADNDTLGIALRKLLKRSREGQFQGTVGELFEEIMPDAQDHRMPLPKSPSALSNALRRTAPMLKTIGIIIEFPRRTNRGSIVIIRDANRQSEGNHGF